MLKDKCPQQVELEMVSEDHLVRLIDMAIDFEFIRDEANIFIVRTMAGQVLTPFASLKSCFSVTCSVLAVNADLPIKLKNTVIAAFGCLEK